MKITTTIAALAMSVLGLLLSSCSKNDDSSSIIRIAVASNFSATIKELAQQYENQTGTHVQIILGSTGKHYAQIQNGAPFDVFLAADATRPELLEKHNAIIPNSRMTYASGKIVLWSPDSTLVDADGSVLATPTFRHLSLANPKLAPYGKVAKEVMLARGCWGSLENNLVLGENVSQALHFIKTGNAELGFIAYSQLKQLETDSKGSQWLVPQHLYSPIEQQAVLLTNKEAATQFMLYLRSNEAKEIIQRHGYDTP